MIFTPDLTFGSRQDAFEPAPVFYNARVTGTSVDNIAGISFAEDGTIVILQKRTIETPQQHGRPFLKDIVAPTKLTVSPQVLKDHLRNMRGWVEDLYTDAIARAYRIGTVADTMYVGNTARNFWPERVDLVRIRQSEADRGGMGRILTGALVREQPAVHGEIKGSHRPFDPISVLGIGLTPIVNDLCRRGARVLKESFPGVRSMGLGRHGQFVQNTPGEQFKPAQLRIGTSSFAQQFCSVGGAGGPMTVIAFCSDTRLNLPSAEMAREFAVSQQLSPDRCVGIAADASLFPGLTHCTTVHVRAGMEEAVKMAHNAGMLAGTDFGYAGLQISRYRLDRFKPAAAKKPAPGIASALNTGRASK